MRTRKPREGKGGRNTRSPSTIHHQLSTNSVIIFNRNSQICFHNPLKSGPLQKSIVHVAAHKLKANNIVRPQPHLVKTLAVISWLAIASVALYATCGVVRPHLLHQRAATIHIGDTKGRVVAVLGWATDTVPAPTATPNFSLFFPQSVSWCYGSKFDWHFSFSRRFPYLVQIVDRSWSFYPWPGDIVVQFDKAGKVVGVQIPKS